MGISDLHKQFKRNRKIKKKAEAPKVSQHLEFESYEPRLLMSAALLPVQGALNHPGQVDQYTFTLPAPTQIYFDSQTPNNQIDWTLTGPNGAIVNTRPFSQSDADQIGGQAAIRLEAGDYKIAVSGQGAATGDYAFQLLDLANAAPAAVGQPVSGTLDPSNSTALYQFQGVAGETVFFDSHPAVPQSTHWRVIGPDGVTMFGPNGLGQDPDTQTLPTDGVYTAMIEGDVGQTAAAPYSFAVFPVSVAAKTLSLGQTVTGALATPGAQDRYDFHLDAPAQALFASLVNRSDVTWTLTGAKGEIVSRRAFSASTSGAADPSLQLGPATTA